MDTPFEITVQALKKALDEKTHLLLDVRTEEEYETQHLSSVHIPLHALPFRMDELPKDKPIAVICRSGARSARAVELLLEAGFAIAVNVKGGFKAWRAELDTNFEVI